MPYRYKNLCALVLGIMCSAVSFLAFAEQEIVIGASAAKTGKYARTGQEQLNGIRMWVEDVNAMGGLLGKPVRLVHYDDESQPEIGTELYERLITDDQVDLLIGPYSSGITIRASAVAENYNIPMVSTGASASKIWSRGYKNVFGLYTPAEEYMNQILEFAKSEGLAKVALIYADTAFPRGIAIGVREKVAALGMDLVFEEKYTKDSVSFSPIILKIRSKKPDVIIGGSYLPDSTAFIRQAKKNQLKAKIFAFAVGPALPDFGKNLGVDAEGVMGNSQWEPNLSLAGIKEFVKIYKEKYDRIPGYHAAGGYGAGQVIEAAIRQSGSIEQDKIRNILLQLDITTIFGHYKVDETGKQIGKPAYTIQWINGKRELILPNEAATTKPVYPFKAWGALASKTLAPNYRIFQADSLLVRERSLIPPKATRDERNARPEK
uniref:Branched-chain amino acid transport system substrate-binding protein n=1 Tax=Candidatus Kentrum sp. TUN TaxID=2126343 RepID=A0A450ZC78_9GAMM|nr:MAG: branched-chain amino acid transport system substrate-binding protein [Candidatus Kentron sp. TUN]VFK51411.1 MAG: branched-chain amino acid transport system substrate-binding protein [Candidatus Kentron sp. TUN]